LWLAQPKKITIVLEEGHPDSENENNLPPKQLLANQHKCLSSFINVLGKADPRFFKSTQVNEVEFDTVNDLNDLAEKPRHKRCKCNILQ